MLSDMVRVCINHGVDLAGFAGAGKYGAVIPQRQLPGVFHALRKDADFKTGR